MTIRSIHPTESLETIWAELVYTEARLQSSVQGREHVPRFGALLKRWEKVAAEQRQHWREELAAQAAIDEQGDALDELLAEIEEGLLRAARRDRGSPRFRRYFKYNRSDVQRKHLESELELVRDWPSSLATEPEAELQALGHRLAQEIKRGDAAVQERSAADAGRADHRVREINLFIDDVNAARQLVYGKLVTAGQQAKLPKRWAEGFFRKKPGNRARGAAPAPEAPAQPTAPTA